VIPLPPCKTLADARKLAKVHVVTTAREPLDRETWGQGKMDSALEIYCEIFGATALQTRLQRALDEAQQLASTPVHDRGEA